MLYYSWWWVLILLVLFGQTRYVVFFCLSFFTPYAIEILYWGLIFQSFCAEPQNGGWTPWDRVGRLSTLLTLIPLLPLWALLSSIRKIKILLTNRVDTHTHAALCLAYCRQLTHFNIFPSFLHFLSISGNSLPNWSSETKRFLHSLHHVLISLLPYTIWALHGETNMKNSLSPDARITNKSFLRQDSFSKGGWPHGSIPRNWMTEMAVLEARSWCMKTKRLGRSRWKVHGLDGPGRALQMGVLKLELLQRWRSR